VKSACAHSNDIFLIKQAKKSASIKIIGISPFVDVNGGCDCISIMLDVQPQPESLIPIKERYPEPEIGRAMIVVNQAFAIAVEHLSKAAYVVVNRERPV
jgi:hypothetical protein